MTFKRYPKIPELGVKIPDFHVAEQRQAVLHICRQHATASAAGRALFAISRLEKKSSNDADRLSKYLARFSLRFEDIRKAG